MFLIFPTLIFWTLFALLCGNPGYVTKALISRVLDENGINEKDIGSLITMREVVLMLNEKNLTKLGLMRLPGREALDIENKAVNESGEEIEL